MGNLFCFCSQPRDTATRKTVKQEAETLEPDERPMLKAMIGPIGGRGPLDSAQEEGRGRFGM